jgi:hypothetical protein
MVLTDRFTRVPRLSFDLPPSAEPHRCGAPPPVSLPHSNSSKWDPHRASYLSDPMPRLPMPPLAGMAAAAARPWRACIPLFRLLGCQSKLKCAGQF